MLFPPYSCRETSVVSKGRNIEANSTKFVELIIDVFIEFQW